MLDDVVGLYWESGLGDEVPALAWLPLSSLAPLAFGLTALAAVGVRRLRTGEALSTRISAVLPKDVHDQVVQLILRTKHDSPLLIVGAIVGMVWTSSGAVAVLARCVSRLLEGVLITCYLASFGLLLGAGVTARIQLGRRLGEPGGQSTAV